MYIVINDVIIHNIGLPHSAECSHSEGNQLEPWSVLTLDGKMFFTIPQNIIFEVLRFHEIYIQYTVEMFQWNKCSMGRILCIIKL